MINSPEVITTGDGSRTLYLPHMGEHYHSVYGAFTESIHVFIRNGLLFRAKPEKTRILEIGFGTGLNALLTALESYDRKIDIEYFSLEKYPLGKEITDKLDYGTLPGGQAPSLFRAIHDAEWNQPVVIHPWFSLFKMEQDLCSPLPEGYPPFDVVYFDAFGPDKQPEMWTKEILAGIHGRMDRGGVFVTYSAKGEIRRRMMAAGFVTERIPGPPGKREMLRGIKK